jgi:hypothetical protein
MLVELEREGPYASVSIAMSSLPHSLLHRKARVSLPLISYLNEDGGV